MKPILQGFVLGYLIVSGVALAVCAVREIRLRLALRDLVREAYEASQSQQEWMF